MTHEQFDNVQRWFATGLMSLFFALCFAGAVVFIIKIVESL